MIILNHATLPDRTQVIMEEKEAVFLESIEKDIKLLELAGAMNIAIPCNTSHYFYDQIQAMTSVNIINMVEETIKGIKHTYGDHSKVALLATDGTVNSGIYETGCHNNKMELHLPTKAVQRQVMDIIYNVKSGLAIDVKGLENIITYLINEVKCSCVILACTELSCLQLSDETLTHCVDAMDVLVKQSIVLSGKEYKD